MPDVIANPYISPLGRTLASFGNALTGGKSEAQNIYMAEQALKLKRAREGGDALANVFSQFGQPAFDRNQAMRDAVIAGYDPQKLADLERYGAANTYGATDPRTDNAYRGAGGAYSGTADAFNQTMAERQRQFNMKPMTVGSPTGPVVVATQDAYGQPAVEDLGKVKGDFARRAMNSPEGLTGLNPTEQKFIGAGQGAQTPRNYMDPAGQRHITYDGVHDAQTGEMLAPGGAMLNVQGTPNQSGLRPNVQGKLQEQGIEFQKLQNLIDYTKELAGKNENNFGLAGWIKGFAQDTTQVAENLAQGLGYTGLDQGVKIAQAKLQADHVDPGVISSLFTFDPALPQLHTAVGLMVYQAASALASQSGRSISDRDVEMFRNIIGDPRDWRGNQKLFFAKMGAVTHILQMNQQVVQQHLGMRGSPSPVAVAPAAPGAPQPAVPPQAAPGAPQIQEGQTATNPQTGQKIVFRNGQWVAQ